MKFSELNEHIKSWENFRELKLSCVRSQQWEKASDFRDEERKEVSKIKKFYENLTNQEFDELEFRRIISPDIIKNLKRTYLINDMLENSDSEK